MSNSILDLALSDFNLDTDTYHNLDRNKLIEITDSMLISNINDHRILSQQILLDNKKKSVSFSNDSPEYSFIIEDEKDTQTKKKVIRYNNPSLEYIDICLAKSLDNKRRKNLQKIKSNNNIL